jgi:epsilon-lactone hydrolase
MMNAHLLLLDTASAGKRRIIMGDSAPAGAVLMCPWVDMECRTQRPSRESPVLFSPAMARRFGRAYLGGQPGDDPALTPLQTDLAGLLPLLIHAASGDSVLQEASAPGQAQQAVRRRDETHHLPVPTCR